MRTALILFFCLAAGSQLAACGGSVDIAQSCDDGKRRYLDAEEHEKLKVPDDLDEPDKLKELPLPEASADGERSSAPCLELPPGVSSQGTRRAQRERRASEEEQDSDE